MFSNGMTRNNPSGYSYHLDNDMAMIKKPLQPPYSISYPEIQILVLTEGALHRDRVLRST
jgi:hypothetical protein